MIISNDFGLTQKTHIWAAATGDGLRMDVSDADTYRRRGSVMKSSGVLHGPNEALWKVISSNRISCSLWLQPWEMCF